MVIDDTGTDVTCAFILPKFYLTPNPWVRNKWLETIMIKKKEFALFRSKFDLHNPQDLFVSISAGGVLFKILQHHLIRILGFYFDNMTIYNINSRKLLKKINISGRCLLSTVSTIRYHK